VTHEYRVEGPVMIFLTTTAIEIDEELLNRCLVLSVDEEREQTRAIHEMQRWGQTLEGMLARAAKKDVLKVHRNAQRLLRPLMVVNPHARELTFVDRQTRSRRDHTKYLGLIRTIALLHQHQRPVKTATHGGQAIEYIEATLDDIAVANRLADQVLGRTLDELPPQTRRLLLLVDEHVGAACARLALERKDFRFSRREVREATGWGNTQLKIHLGRLEELEYLTVHRGSRGQGFVYELAYDGKGKDGAPFLSGLIDLERLGYDEKKSGVTAWWSGLSAKRSAPSRAEVGGVSGGGRGAVLEEIPEGNARNGLSPSRNAHQGAGANGLPYSHDSVVLAAAAAEPKVN
jgi:DNA primase